MLLLIVHILSAVTGFGPMFQAWIIRHSAGNLIEAQHSLKILRRTGKAPLHSLPVAVITGIGLIWIGNIPWNQGWLITSVVLLIGVAVLLYRVFPDYLSQAELLLTEKIIGGQSNDTIPPSYRYIDKQLHRWE